MLNMYSDPASPSCHWSLPYCETCSHSVWLNLSHHDVPSWLSFWLTEHDPQTDIQATKLLLPSSQLLWRLFSAFVAMVSTFCSIQYSLWHCLSFCRLSNTTAQANKLSLPSSYLLWHLLLPFVTLVFTCCHIFSCDNSFYE